MLAPSQAQLTISALAHSLKQPSTQGYSGIGMSNKAVFSKYSEITD